MWTLNLTGNALLVLREKAQIRDGKRGGFCAEEAQGNAFAVEGGEGGDTDVHIVCAMAEVDAPVLGAAALRDVQLRHDFQARDEGGLEVDKIVGQAHRGKFSVNAVTDDEGVLLRFEMDIRGTIGCGLGNDFIDEADDGCIFIFLLLGFFLDTKGLEVCVTQGAGTDTEVFLDCGVNDVWRGNVPQRVPASEGEYPCIHSFVWRPVGGKGDFAGVSRLRGNGEALVFVDEADGDFLRGLRNEEDLFDEWNIETRGEHGRHGYRREASDVSEQVATARAWSSQDLGSALRRKFREVCCKVFRSEHGGLRLSLVASSVV